MAKIKVNYDIEKTLNNMKQMRLDAGMTQLDIANILGVDRSQVSKWENRTSNPDFENLVRLYRLLHGIVV